MTAVLVLGAGAVFWYGLIGNQRWLTLSGSGVMLLVFWVWYQHGALQMSALIVAGGAGLLACALKYDLPRGWRIVGWATFILFTLALGFRLIPGFSSVTWAAADMGGQAVRFAPEKVLLLLLLAPMVLIPWSVCPREGAADWRATGSLLVITPTLLGVLAWASGFATPGTPSASPTFIGYWLAANLLYTCVVEEAFFRGIVQNAAAVLLQHGMTPCWAAGSAILVASLLFGLAHLGGGVLYSLLAMLAGVTYGMAYILGGRLHHAVLVHFVVNAVHFLALSGD